MVEFVIALPILLFVIFGIIEFARLTFAWMAVQNSARFGIRYAVTGEFNEVYCVSAGNYLGADHVNADVFNGDPQDCLIPDDYTGTDANDKERELIDLARLYSIQDATSGGGAGLWLDPAASGDYSQYLSLHDEAQVGQVDQKGFFHVTVCSNRENQFVVDYFNYSVPLCIDNFGGVLMDDAGGPGDRVKVRVQHQHPLFLPILSNIWPSVSLNAERDGIVERFRVTRILGVSGPILSAPTWTQTPTVTDTPTITPSPTPTSTSTPTNTPIPVQCDLIEVVNSYAGHWTSGYYINSVTIRNNNPVPINFYSAEQIWQKNDPGRYLWAAQFSTSGWHILNDLEPPTTWSPSPAIELGAGGDGEYIALFQPKDVPLEGLTSVDLVFDDDCHKGVTVDVPTPTNTPVPNCDLYSLSGFDFHNSSQQEIMVTNGDLYDTRVTRIRFDWTYIEQFGEANAFGDLLVDWFTWNGADAWGYGEGSAVDISSWTDTNLDTPASWKGPLQFNAGNAYAFRIDFDGAPGSGSLPNVNAEDFGLIIDFENGCQLSQAAIHKEVVTWTPTITPLPSNTPTPTITPTPTPTPTASLTPSITPLPSNTPIPDCDAYSLGNISFKDWAILNIYLENKDIVDANLVSLELTWDYAEQLGVANGYNDLNVDWFIWNGGYIHLGGNGDGVKDYNSSTIWSGSQPFNAGVKYKWEIDFDADWGGGGPLTSVQTSDFGIIAHFDNGCTVTRNAVPRTIATFTATPVPSNTPLPSNTPISSNTPLPTNTPIPPTATKTPVPTATSVPSATNTLPPPTETPIPTWTPACPYDDPNWPCQPTWTPGP
ncbi:MAG: pilus assembly protein [Anaerolineales bacterium]|nr:pilus assembly protein [Anaerolineales bacterium]